ncbi:MAG: 3-deoxy-manno-octulosonate cytidylyltransferase [Bacteroidales bacterium]|nr:3-deoxy-manno-octulosonate cytidylyltransferase [Bacteroidales bacterium]
MKVVAIIPARYASTRFPGKPLALLRGKPMVQHVVERASAMECLDSVVVATDDVRIYDTVTACGGRVLMTDSSHPNGTSRCAEALRQLQAMGEQYDVVVNIQGDEPRVAEQQIETLVRAFENEAVQIATLKKRIGSLAELQSPNVVKVVTSLEGDALYFSRFPIPYFRGVAEPLWMEQTPYFKHVGVYAFRADVLPALVALSSGLLERAESLEQLRWLEHGYRIAVRETMVESFSVDTPADLEKLKNLTQQ